MASECGADNTKGDGSVWAPVNNTDIEVIAKLPQLPYLPTELIKFCGEKPCIGGIVWGVWETNW